MRMNINNHLQGKAVNRFKVEFVEEDRGKWSDKLIGRGCHLAYVSSVNFLRSLVLGYSHFFA